MPDYILYRGMSSSPGRRGRLRSLRSTVYDRGVTVGDKVQNYLAPLLGAHTARVAVKTFAEKIGKSPETLSQHDLGVLAQSMHGMLRTLCGAEKADKAVKDIAAL